MKTLVCTNVLDSVKSIVYGSHCQEWFRLGRDTTDEFVLFHPERFSIDNARTQAAKYAMLLECDYIWFLDDDMVLSGRTYKSLKECDADVAMALTYIRGIPFNPMFFKNESSNGKATQIRYYTDWEADVNHETGVVECYAVGFACTLLKVSRLLEMSPPYFITSSHQTEDVYYCCKLKQFDPLSKIVVDTKVSTGHVLSPEIVSPKTRKKLLEYYSDDIKNSEKDKLDRGSEYFDEVKMIFSK